MHKLQISVGKAVGVTSNSRKKATETDIIINPVDKEVHGTGQVAIAS